MLGEGSEGEWAVDKILVHSGSVEESIFQIKWKAGDITWLPYYQITHLDALPIYLDLLGVDSVSKLPKGQGRPPKDDPQIFIGSILLQKILKPHLRISAIPSPAFTRSPKNPPLKALPHHHHRSADMTTPDPPTPAVIPDVAAPAVITAMPKVPWDTRHTTIVHCCFRRPSLTTIMGTDPIDSSVVLYHVGQIVLYCLTDACLRKNKPPHHDLPAGYEQFMALFNAWADNQQTKRFASYDPVLNKFNLTVILSISPTSTSPMTSSAGPSPLHPPNARAPQPLVTC